MVTFLQFLGVQLHEYKLWGKFQNSNISRGKNTIISKEQKTRDWRKNSITTFCHYPQHFQVTFSSSNPLFAVFMKHFLQRSRKRLKFYKHGNSHGCNRANVSQITIFNEEFKNELRAQVYYIPIEWHQNFSNPFAYTNSHTNLSSFHAFSPTCCS